MPRSKGPDAFDELRRIFLSLKSSEQKIVKAHATAYDVRNGESIASAKLVQFLIDTPKGSRARCKAAVSPSSSNDSFDRLCRRTQEKVIETLTLRCNVHRRGQYVALTKVKLDLPKLIASVRVLQAKGLRDDAKALLRKVINTSKRFEQYGLLHQALTMWKWIEGANLNAKEFRKYKRKCEAAFAAQAAVEKAQDYFFEYHFEEKRLGDVSSPKLNKFLTAQIAELNELFEQTNAAFVYYMSRKLLGLYYSGNKAWDSYFVTSQQLINIVSAKPFLFQRRELPFLLHDAGICRVHQMEFEKADMLFMQAKEKYGAGTIFQKPLTSDYAGALLYRGQIEQAEELLKELAEPLLDSNQDQAMVDAVILYNCAYCYFLLPQFDRAYAIIRQITGFKGQSAAYDVGLRILECMVLIEQGNNEELRSCLKNAFDFLKRLDSSDEGVRKRDVVILQALRIISKENLNWDEAGPNIKAAIAKLESPEPDYRWEIRTHEVAIFQEWLRAKMQQVEYVHTIPEHIAETLRLAEPALKIGAA